MSGIPVVDSANVDFTIAASRFPGPGETVRHVYRPCDSKIQEHGAWAKGEKASFFPYGKTQAQVAHDIA